MTVNDLIIGTYTLLTPDVVDLTPNDLTPEAFYTLAAMSWPDPLPTCEGLAHETSYQIGESLVAMSQWLGAIGQ